MSVVHDRTLLTINLRSSFRTSSSFSQKNNSVLINGNCIHTCTGLLVSGCNHDGTHKLLMSVVHGWALLTIYDPTAEQLQVIFSQEQFRGSSGKTLNFRPLGPGFKTWCIQVWGPSSFIWLPGVRSVTHKTLAVKKRREISQFTHSPFRSLGNPHTPAMGKLVTLRV